MWAYLVLMGSLHDSTPGLALQEGDVPSEMGDLYMCYMCDRDLRFDKYNNQTKVIGKTD